MKKIEGIYIMKKIVLSILFTTLFAGISTAQTVVVESWVCPPGKVFKDNQCLPAPDPKHAPPPPVRADVKPAPAPHKPAGPHAKPTPPHPDPVKAHGKPEKPGGPAFRVDHILRENQVVHILSGNHANLTGGDGRDGMVVHGNQNSFNFHIHHGASTLTKPTLPKKPVHPKKQAHPKKPPQPKAPQ